MSATFRSAARSRGFALMTAVFILVVLAGLGVFLVATMSAQQRSSTADFLGSRAYQAARVGIEYGVRRALRDSVCPTVDFQLTGNLSQFHVNVDCASENHTEAATTVTMYRITATACNRAACPANADGAYIERQLRVSVGSN